MSEVMHRMQRAIEVRFESRSYWSYTPLHSSFEARQPERYEGIGKWIRGDHSPKDLLLLSSMEAVMHFLSQFREQVATVFLKAKLISSRSQIPTLI